MHLFNLLKNWQYNIKNQFKMEQKINQFDIVIFLRQLATLLNAGVPIIESCQILEESQEKPLLCLLIYALKQEILSGKSLQDCFSLFPHYFNSLVCQLIQIGEHTGKLDFVFESIAILEEKNMLFLKRIKQILFYPCLVTLISLLITFSMFIFVIPRFSELFHESGLSLSWSTKIIFFLSHWLCQMITPLFTILILLLPLIFLMRTHLVGYFSNIKKILIKLPIIAPLMQKIYLARFIKNLSVTLNAGIPIREALKLSNEQTQIHLPFDLNQLMLMINRGQSLHFAMNSMTCFPHLIVQMVKVGESSGTLEYMLAKCANFLENEINHQLEKINQLLPPLIMLVLGALIGGLVISLYLPIFKLGSALS